MRGFEHCFWGDCDHVDEKECAAAYAKAHPAKARPMTDVEVRAMLRMAEEALRQICAEYPPSKRRMVQIAEEALEDIGELGHSLHEQAQGPCKGSDHE